MLDTIITILIEIGLIHPRLGKKEKDISAGNRFLRFIVFVVVPVVLILKIFTDVL